MVSGHDARPDDDGNRRHPLIVDTKSSLGLVIPDPNHIHPDTVSLLRSGNIENSMIEKQKDAKQSGEI